MQTFFRISYLLAFCILFSTTTFAQMHNGQFGNEWINHNQSHYKIKIAEDGFYSVDKQVLENYISNLQQINPQSIQLFHMGQEVPVYVDVVNGQIEGVSFYAEKNKGDIDVNLYRKANNHFNPEYSLISDTAAYFLTWNTNGNARQYQNRVSSFNNIPAKENYFMHESKTVLNQTWNQGQYRNYGGYILSNGTFDFGEGYGGAFLKNNNISVNTPFAISQGPAPTVNVRAYAFGFSYHNLQLAVGNHSQSYSSYYGDSVIDLSIQIAHSDINSNSTNVAINGLSGNNDKHAVSVVSVTYPRGFDFEGKSLFKFNVAASSNRKFLEIDNFNGGSANTQNVYLYDLTNNIRTQCYWDGSKVRVELTASSLDRELILVNETAKSIVHGMYSTDFVNYSIARGDYIVITHPALFSDSQGNNPIFDYCAYRTTTGHMPVVVDVNRLFDQFAYGVNGHPVAIKNFVAFIKKNWLTIVPENVFLIGKGRIYTEVRSANASDNMIPTFGYPPSDNLLLAPIGSDVPVLPVGRLAATNGDQVTDYLNKIKTLETAAKDSINVENQNWRKQTLHLGGGANVWEHNILKSHLINMEPVMENGMFGANVHSFFKEQDEHVSVPNSQRINELINNGVSMITFFGHGSTKGFDFYLDAPERYSNKDKYPLVMALGCYNGTIFGSSKLLSERFIFEKEAGAIGYLGFVNAVTISAARNLSTTFYDLINNDLYGAGMGEVLKRTLEDFTSTSNYSYNPVFQMGSQYLVYHGDPALKLNYRSTPDFHIDESTISTYPEKITEDVRNFKLLVDVYNFGKYVDSSFTVKVVRTHPSGLVDTCSALVSAPKDKKTVEFMFDVNGYEDFGLNAFSVFVDANNVVVESPAKAEANNKVINFSVVVGNPVVLPVYPKEFAIVRDSVLTLKAMATNAFENDYTWIIEMDTTIDFDSPELIQTTTMSGSSLAEWTPGIVMNDDQVYYWRVKALDANQQASDWANASFVYKSNAVSEGWNQSHVYQYQKNELNNMLVEKNQSNTFEFTPSLYEISAKTGYIGYGVDNENLALYQNGSKVDKCRCSYENGVYVAVMDPATLNFWTLPGGSTKYGAVNCDGANRTAYSFLFKNNSSNSQESFESFVTDSIPDGHLVVIYTLNNGHGERWSDDFVAYLKTQGSVDIESFTNSDEESSYAIAYKKGYASYPHFSEEVGYNKDDVAAAYTAAEKAWDQGSMTSPLVGPAQSWNSLEWSATQIEAPGYDSVSVDVWGVNQYGEKQLLFARATAATVDLSNVDAQQFPYLQLTLNNKDESYATPAQLDFWRVYGELNIDGALTVEDDYSIEFDAATNQQNVVIDLAVWNMGAAMMDSSEVEFIVLGAADTTNREVAAMNASDSANIQINIPMLGLIGQQIIVAKLKAQNSESTLSNNWGWVEVNVPNAPAPSSEVIGKEDLEDVVIGKLNNYPNPFSTQTRIEFELNENSFDEMPEEVSIELYDTRGALIKKTIQPAQELNTWTWNGENQESLSMPSGMYFCRVLPIYESQKANDQAQQKIIKIVLAR